MIQCFNIEGGRVSWRNRWVKSEKFKRELAAGKRLFGVFGNPMMSDPSVIGAEYNTGNTHIVEHAGTAARADGRRVADAVAATLARNDRYARLRRQHQRDR